MQTPGQDNPTAPVPPAPDAPVPPTPAAPAQAVRYLHPFVPIPASAQPLPAAPTPLATPGADNPFAGDPPPGPPIPMALPVNFAPPPHSAWVPGAESAKPQNPSSPWAGASQTQPQPPGSAWAAMPLPTAVVVPTALPYPPAYPPGYAPAPYPPPPGMPAWPTPAGPIFPAWPAASLLARPWGAWASVGWTLLLHVVVVVVSVLVGVVVGVALAGGQAFGSQADVQQVVQRYSGLLTSLISIAATPVCLALVCLLVWVRKVPIREYLGLGRFTWVQAIVAVGAMAGFIAVETLLSMVAKRPTPESMIEMYHSAGSLPLLLFSVVILAPLLEETVFRGFLFEGLARSPAGPIWAIFITSGWWAGIHLQYEFFEIFTIFLAGILMGLIRWRTGSVILPMVMHALMNLWASSILVLHMEGVI